MPSVPLKCKGDKIVDGDENVITLRGACLGAYLLQENFTNGYPGHEKAYRAAMLKVLGQEKYDFFWNKFYEYFYDAPDAKWFASLGLNMQRLAINYRHLNDDLDPYVIKEEGFKWIDRVVELNAAEGIYTIIDLHAAPGGQNFDWHSDNNTPVALLWEYKEFQDRTVRIWEAIAKHYKGHPWVAGYNLLNEPTDEAPGAARLLSFYKRLADAIRAIDPDHILCFDGNTFGADFRSFDKAGFDYPNSIFSCHDYSMFGFPIGMHFEGTDENRAKVRDDYERKVEFSKKTNSPIWNGEFGVVYATETSEGPDFEAINEKRYGALSEQLKVYGEDKISWTIWLYKDVGVQGMVYAKPDSAWNTTFKERIEKKRKHALEFWGTDDTATTKAFQPVLDWITETFPEAIPKYPGFWQLKQHLFRRTIYTWISDNLNPWFCEPLKDMSFEDLDKLAASFKFENCQKREKLIEVMTKGAGESQ
ncbi:putative glucanase [Naematelia encephala]|uniref:Putative glucanase n=1 Tax=Naematelia encephala TaxID=71784 RepID=A0A1Y2AQV0_9TREE|nr:putative glucanase [Naematelia encephala]